MIDAAELLGAWMYMHELRLRLGNIKDAIALRRHFAETPADEQHQVGIFHACEQFRVRADAEVAGVAAMHGVKQMAPAEGRCDRQRKALGEPHERGARGLGPTAAADE